MSFVRANSGGFIQGQTIEAAEINTIDTNQSKAVDGDAGGDYSPSSPIVLKTGAVRLQAEVGTIEYQSLSYPTCTTKSVSNMIALNPSRISDLVNGTGSENAGNDFLLSNLYVFQAYVNAAAGSDPICIFPFVPNPYYGTLTQLAFFFIGAAGLTDLPVRMPMIKLYSLDYNSLTPTLEATVTDASTPLAVYKAAHTVQATGLTIDIDNTDFKSWFVEFTGEGGTNAIGGGSLLGLRYTIAVTRFMP